MLKTRNLGAYRDLLVLFTRYGRKDFRLKLAPEDFLAAEAETGEMEPDVAARGQAFANALKEMGPTYVKFGQLLSTRPDVVPPEYIGALESLQDNLEPFSFADVERIVRDTFPKNIEVRTESRGRRRRSLATRPSCTRCS
jgi:ubiquinone biosynthesis protein